MTHESMTLFALSGTRNELIGDRLFQVDVLLLGESSKDGG